MRTPGTGRESVSTSPEERSFIPGTIPRSDSKTANRTQPWSDSSFLNNRPRSEIGPASSTPKFDLDPSRSTPDSGRASSLRTPATGRLLESEADHGKVLKPSY